MLRRIFLAADLRRDSAGIENFEKFISSQASSFRRVIVPPVYSVARSLRLLLISYLRHGGDVNPLDARTRFSFKKWNRQEILDARDV